MANRKELVLETQDTGCIVPVSHKLNHDGYFRKQVWVGDKLQLMMYHRYVWMLEQGAIPPDYEINHKCHNRACCNIEHLECIHGHDHAVLTNVERGKTHKYKAYWLEHRCSGKVLGEMFNISQSVACRHIRNWKKSNA